MGKKGVIHIKYVVSNAKDILEKMKPYFSLLLFFLGEGMDKK
jgi:hypothetical protein